MESSHMWMNLGYWKTARTLPEACQGLAELVSETAKLSIDDTILDVGFGCGDQDIFWATKYKPRMINGVNASRQQTMIARDRINMLGLSGNVSLEEGSATELNFSDSIFSKVVSLDSAYHYNTRAKFFAEAFRVLRRGGQLVLTDITVEKRPQTWWGKLGMRLFAYAASVPFANLYNIAQYEEVLREAGFVDIKITPIEEHVFPGFVEFVSRHKAHFGDVTKGTIWSKFTATADGLGRVYRAGSWRYILVSATRPGDAPAARSTWKR